MKHFSLNIRWLIMSLLLCVGVGNAWGEKITDYTQIVSGQKYYIGATTGTTDYYLSVDGSSTTNSIAGTAVTSSASATAFTFTGSGTTWTIQFESGNYLSLKSSKDNGKVVVSASSSNFTASNQDNKIRLTIGSYSVQKNNSGTQFGSYANTQTDIWLEPAAATPTVATPTFSPAAGAVLANTEVTITCETEGATIHYTIDGSTPTSGSATYSTPIVVDAAKTIKAFAVKSGYNNSEVATATYSIASSVSTYEIDFENPLSAYSNWTFNNIGTTNTAITAHGESKYGANINESGNGVSTASIQTKDKVARPGTFTCYVSKVSTNTTSSTWYIQVSSDGETWTDVGTQSATSMTKGTWVAFTADLSSHTNVYVRLYYNGSTAIRAVDDISLTESTSTGPVNPTFEWSAATATATVGTTPTLPTLSNNSDGTVTYSSSDPGVATIDASGKVTLVAAGETTITASVAATANYNAATATYTLTVSEATPAGQLVEVDSDGNVTFLFNEEGWTNLPTGSSNKAIGTATLTNSGYSLEIYAGAGYYYNSDGYLLMGKNGAYLTLPAFDFDVDRIEVVGKSGASGAVEQNIYVEENAASTATTGATGTNLYNIVPAYQTAGNIYTLKVTSDNNTQITSITVYKKSTTPSLMFTSATADVYVGEAYTQTVNAYNTGSNAITYATSNAEIATVDNSTGEVTGVSAGTVIITASVTVDGVEYTATYELTVNKNNPELSFAQAVVSITEGETYAGQTVTKPSDILDSEITYSSNNPSVATVDAATGAITVGSALGSATITATFAGNTKYNAATATYTFKVTAASGASGEYVKVTSTEDLTDGEYLIVYEDGPVAFNGALQTMDANGNRISVTISDEKIESSDEVDAAAFTIETIDGGYSISNADGLYIGNSSNSNALNTSESPLLNSISFDNDGNVNIVGSGGAYLRYNANTNSWRFRYFKSSTYTAQKAIQLYKKTNSGPIVAAPVITPETGTYETRPQTVSITCSTAGATIHYTTDGTTPTTSSPVYSDSFDVNKNTTVQAIAVLTVDGQEVVSRVSSSVISMLVHAPVFSPIDGSEFSEDYQVTISADAGLTIYYITQDNKIFKSATGKTASYSESTGELVSTALVYSSQLTFGQSMMVTAICMDADGNLSDPVTVKYTYTGSVVPPYFSSFSASEGDFTKTQETDENTITGSGAPEWKMNSNTGADAIARWGEERYYMYVRGTSGNTVQSRTRWYGSAYLTSPIIDLTGKGSASFSFIHAAHHFYADPNESASEKDASLESTLSDAKIPQACKVQVGVCDDSGNVSSWTDIASTSITWPEQLFDPSKTGVSADGKSTTNASSRSGLFPRANSGDISLSEYEDQKIRIRFAYTSTPQNYGTWNIDQITVNAVDVEEMTMNAKGWTTYVFDHDIDAYQTTQNYISGDEETLKIYKVTEFDHENCVLQQLGKFEEYTTENNSERYIPAKTPVVIEGPAGATIDFVEYTSSSMLPTVKNNLLIASLNPNLAVAPQGSGVRYFVLQWNNSTNAPWFNKVSEGRSVPDHKAYLNGTDQVESVSTTQSIKERGIYVIGGEEAGTATAIENVESTKDKVQGTIYNLSGQRVLNPTKGIYIVNGKKVLFK